MKYDTEKCKEKQLKRYSNCILRTQSVKWLLSTEEKAPLNNYGWILKTLEIYTDKLVISLIYKIIILEYKNLYFISWNNII